MVGEGGSLFTLKVVREQKREKFESESAAATSSVKEEATTDFSTRKLLFVVIGGKKCIITLSAFSNDV